jgi:hypothetical protein
MGMIDVHAPHERIGGFKDFLLHLLTITIGLLIALSMEGCVEWQHNRHLVRDAEVGLRKEVKSNAQGIGPLRQQVKDENKQLDMDLAALAALRAHPEAKHERMGFTFKMTSFDDMAWRTAQTTGAFGYMPYQQAIAYSDIYDTQDAVYKVQQEEVDDVLQAASLVVTQPDDSRFTPGQIDLLTDRIGLVRMRLTLLGSFLDRLDTIYTSYLSGHK